MAWRILMSGLVLSFITLVPLGMKWEIEKKVYIPAALCMGILAGTAINGLKAFGDLTFFQVLIFQIVVIGAISTSLLLWRFYRDPERIPPEDENAILSPADGKVRYVKHIEQGHVPLSEKNGRKFLLDEFVQSDLFPDGGYLVGITMSYLDVHVNRAPISGRISLLKHISGLCISLKRKEAVIQNERVFSVIDNGRIQIGIVQIASRLVRKIVPYIKEGHEIKKGERIGVIHFGSQVDLILPDLPTLSIEVKPGEKVKGGISIVAKLIDH